jgi:hypothetical protein
MMSSAEDTLDSHGQGQSPAGLAGETDGDVIEAEEVEWRAPPPGGEELTSLSFEMMMVILQLVLTRKSD